VGETIPNSKRFLAAEALTASAILCLASSDIGLRVPVDFVFLGIIFLVGCDEIYGRG
jgi:hypothetical protein